MSIDLRAETIVSYREVVARVLPAREGRGVHVGTLHRWRSKGMRGARLESLKVGGRWHTSLEALQRFFDRLSGCDPGTDLDRPSSPISGRCPEETLRELAAEGFGPS
jgi:hypothetical protein